MYCPIICCPAGARGTSMLPCGGMAAGWKLGGRSIEEKLSLLSDDAAASSSEDKSTTAGCRSGNEEAGPFFCFILSPHS